ncbi:hypothetical protein [Edaphovirga cremea]|uniref:hypothetical protein n=1 Tax=Edaphovirga cremea TaxID=2267246 RepID=UPI000DEF41D4|nr:hypothetical protein [Edaphovirga cremea]
MICRTWHGCVPVIHAEGFAKHLQLTGIQHSKSIAGNLGAFVRRETQAGYEHFFLATYWENLAAVKAFAGEDYSIAVTYSEDEKFALISDPYVFHHQVESIVGL